MKLSKTFIAIPLHENLKETQINFVISKIKKFYKNKKINLFYPTLIYNLLGTEFKTAACHVTSVLHHMEIQCGKEGMKAAKFNNTMGATSGCTIRLLLNSIPVERKVEKFYFKK